MENNESSNYVKRKVEGHNNGGNGRYPQSAIQSILKMFTPPNQGPVSK